MRVEHVVPVRRQPDYDTQLDEGKSQAPVLSTHDPAAKSQSGERTRSPTHDEFDDDAHSERDELLRQPRYMTSHGPKVWQVKGSSLKLSALEAVVAVKGGIYTFEDFTL